jgi:hypothetical protein
MSTPISIEHDHEPILRVVRANWADPLDLSFSKANPDNRWNTEDFPALYCCCSELVARAVAEDILGYAGIDIADLQPGFRPQKTEISWSGKVVDVISEEGVTQIGLPSHYPVGVERSQTRALSIEWFEAHHEGVVCRSASLMRKKFSAWKGSHEPWSEVAIYTSNASIAPRLLSRTELRLS